MRDFAFSYAYFNIQKQHLRLRAVVGYGDKIFGPGLFIMSPDHLGVLGQDTLLLQCLSLPGCINGYQRI